ncbi:MAG: fibronectin type III domain-containing protein, partial [Pirellulales bacterium]|nr:fibronectin type III domain-containing protein [Pirellulales bacterium]
MLSAADLTDWAGVGNLTSPNNYGVISSMSAGGTIDGRRYGTGEAAGYLADTLLSVSGGELTATTSGGFGATGTLTFDASTDNTSVVDPVFYFGFFDKDNLASGAFGFTIANQTTSSFRFRASAGTTQTTGNGTTLSEGTYTFDIDVNNTDSGAGKVRFRLVNSSQVTVVDVNVTIPGSGTPVADSFGILQPLASTDADPTFSLTVSSINYTGETQVVIPTAPSALTATAAPGQVSVAWQDNSTNETGFTIERRIEAGGSWEVLATLPANSSTYINTGLSDGTTYYYRVRASSATGVSGWSNEASATTPTTPAAPSSLTATAAAGQVSLSWTDNSSNETGFAIERRTGAGGAWGQLSTTAANQTSFVDTELAASTTYYYRVRAVHMTLESAFSNEASATTPSPAGMADLSGFTGVGNTSAPNNYFVISPTSVGGTLDARRITGEGSAYLADTSLSVAGGVLTATTSGGFGATGTLTFDASTDDASLVDPVFYLGFFDKDTPASGAFGFTIANETTSSFRFRASAGTTQTSGNGTVLTQGVYTFDLDVNNTDSGANNVRFRLVNPATSATVVDVNVTIPGSGTPTADSFGILQPTIGTDSDATFGLTLNNINYTGETVLSTPAAPSSLTATALTGQISMEWVNNATNATGNSIERKIGAGGTWAQLVTVAVDATSYVDTGLSDGTTYYYRVRAFNSAGDSAWSSEASATTPSIPNAPSDLAATAATREVSLTWQDNATNETGFVIERKIGAGSYSTLTTVGADVTSYTNTGLSDGTTYTYRVLAQNAAGSSGYSNEASATTPTAPAIPATPTGLSATASTGQVSLAWTDNATNETGYSVERRTGAAGTWAEIATPAANATSYVNNTSITAGATYYYRVRANNSGTYSAYSNEAFATTPVAAGVADLSGFTGVGNTSAPNNYTASTTTAGGTIDARRFGAGEAAAYLADTSLSVGVLAATTSGGFGARGTLSFDASTNDSSLADPVFYLGFFDKDNPASGAFGFSLADSSTTAFRFRATAGTTQTTGSGVVVAQGTYAFDLDVNNADSGAGKVRFRLVNSAAVTALDVNVTIPAGLALQSDSFGLLQPLAPSDSDVTFGLTLSNINYTGETLTGAQTAPTAPSNLAATAGDNQVSLSWTDNSNNEENFIVESKIGAGSYSTLVTLAAGVISYVNTGLTAGTTYTYRVKAQNGAGSSSFSNEASAVPTAAATAPTAPSGLAATPSTGQVSLSWTDNSNNETNFAVERRLGTSGTFVQIAAPAANANSYVDTGLAANTTYQYRVRAQNGGLNSAYTSVVTATTPVASSIYYISTTGSDTNNGTSTGTAWKTFDKALRTAPANSIVYLQAGTYSQAQTTLTNPGRTGLVTFKPAAGAVVTISGLVDWKLVTDVRLEGLKFTNFVQVRETENFEFVNNDVTNAGIAVYGADGALVEENNFHGYTAGYDAILFRSYNIYVIPGSNPRDFRADNVVIRNNIVDKNNQLGDAIHVEKGTNALIEKNVIKNVRTTKDAHGDSIQLVEVDTSTITGNIITGGRGIIVHHFLTATGANISPY